PPEDRCLEDNGGCHAQASCKDLHYHERTAGVFYLSSPLGVRYQLNLTEAQSACSQQGATLASFKQLADAQQLGMHVCIAGWLEGGRVGYPITLPSPRCGDGHVGVVLYKEPVSPSNKYDAYCYRQTGRDLEYHVSANHSRRLYQDLQHQEVIRTWLGANLTVQTSASLSPAPSSSLSAIFVVLLLGLGAGGGVYFLWRRQKTPFNFQYFKNETEAVPASMLSINNPLYSEHTDSEQASDLVGLPCRGDSKP
ncbi:hypothetical protein CRUP_012747, partial [Coryphaenoides rupestris]